MIQSCFKAANMCKSHIQYENLLTTKRTYICVIFYTDELQFYKLNGAL